MSNNEEIKMCAISWVLTMMENTEMQDVFQIMGQHKMQSRG